MDDKIFNHIYFMIDGVLEIASGFVKIVTLGFITPKWPIYWAWYVAKLGIKNKFQQ